MNKGAANNLSVSVVIPVRNGGDTLDRCLKSLRDQTIGQQLQIIVLDSMSTDDSIHIARRYGAEIIEISTGTFNHGLTRNFGAAHATGTLVFFSVQDAWIAETDMLERMAAHFKDDELCAVCGHQAVPQELDKNPAKWFKRYTVPTVETRQFEHVDEFKDMHPDEQLKLFAWDNVVSMYRKSSLIAQPFVATEFAEDCVWAYQALEKGWKLIYDPSIVVYHYHHHFYRYAFSMTYAVNYHFYIFFNRLPKPSYSILPLAKVAYHLLKNPLLSFSKKMYWIAHNVEMNTAIFFSKINFLYRLKFNGRAGLEKGYKKYCGSVPQGKQNN